MAGSAHLVAKAVGQGQQQATAQHSTAPTGRNSRRAFGVVPQTHLVAQEVGNCHAGASECQHVSRGARGGVHDAAPRLAGGIQVGHGCLAGCWLAATARLTGCFWLADWLAAVAAGKNRWGQGAGWREDGLNESCAGCRRWQRGAAQAGRELMHGIAAVWGIQESAAKAEASPPSDAGGASGRQGGAAVAATAAAAPWPASCGTTPDGWAAPFNIRLHAHVAARCASISGAGGPGRESSRCLVSAGGGCTVQRASKRL